MVASQAVAYSFMANTIWSSIIISVIAFVGVWSFINFKPNAVIKYAVLFVLGIGVAIMTVYSKFSYPLALVPYFNGPLIYFAVHFLLGRQAIEFFISANNRLSKEQPVYGIIVLIFIGSVKSDSSQNLIFLLCTIGFILSASLFTTFSWTQDENNRRSLHLRAYRSFVSVIVLLIVAAVTWLSGIFLISLDKNVTRYMYERVNLPTSTGFSDRAELGSMVYKKSHSEKKVVLRVFTDRNPIYLRAKAYNVYKSQGWFVKSKEKSVLPGHGEIGNLPSIEKDLNTFVLKKSESKDWITTQVWAADSSGRAMFTPLNADIIVGSLNELSINENDTIVSKGRHKKNYRIFSSKEMLPLQIPDIQKEQFLGIPKNLHPDVKSLAENIFEGCDDTVSKITAVEEYFNKEYDYKLGIQIPEKTDPLTYFLLEKPPAHCEYFATGAAVLLRLAGVPCRYVNGFVLAEWNSLGEYWIARNRDAHAWVEAYDDKKGWTIVEATPAGGVPAALSKGKAAHVWDYVKHCFRVFRASLSLGGLKGLISKCLSLFSGKRHFPVYIVVGLIFVLFILPGIFFGKRICKRKRKLVEEGPIINSLHRLLEEMDQQLKKHGLERKYNETIHQFAGRITKEKEIGEQFKQSSRWYKEYASVRFNGKADASSLEYLKTKMDKTVPKTFK